MITLVEKSKKLAHNKLCITTKLVHKMSFFWLLLLSSHLAISSSLAKFEDKDLSYNQNGMHLNLYHVTNLDPSKNSQFSYSDMFQKDEDRVRYIHSRLSDKVYKVSDKSEEQKLLSTPLKSGLSIGSGNYYVKIGLGTPASYFSMIVDTGSSLSWLQCKPCVVYCHDQIEPIFDPSKSKTYKTFPCSSIQCSSLKSSTLNDPSCSKSTGSCVYKASYGDSSYSLGYLSQDVLAFSQTQRVQSFVYGCGQDNQGLFGKASGILGLAQDKLSFLAQLSKQYGYAFSYCLPTSFSSPNSTKLGFLSIGTSSLEPISSYKFTPLLKNPKIQSLYFVDLITLTVSGKPIGVSASSYKVPTIIDSGTVITRLPEPVYNALRSDFVKIMSRKFQQVPGVSILDTCFKGSVKGISGFVPQVEMIFNGGAGLALRPQNVLIDIEDGTTCLAIASSGMNPIAIIGNYQQQTFKVAYDIANSRLGFAPAGCQ